MRESVSFSKEDIERTSLNFTELREKGIEYIQQFSGDVWTDYNSHDPGVTILEQLCYALTDIGFRTSLPVEDLLIPGKGMPVDPKKNAFFSPSSIFSSHPVTILDMRKMIISSFDEIQNVWFTALENSGYQEELRGINKIEILPKLNFLNTIKINSDAKDEFQNRLNKFLSENRNLGEKFENTCLLEPQFIAIDFDVHIKEAEEVEKSLANLFLKLFEYIYSPVQYCRLNELEEDQLSTEEIFSGPKPTKGFIKNNLPDKRLKSIHVDELQKIFSKVTGIDKSEVRNIIFDDNECISLKVEKDKFFHLLLDGNTGTMAKNRFESIYSNMNVLINNKPVPSFNKQKVNNLFFEAWSKKHRGYSLSIKDTANYNEKLKGTFRNPGNYYSIQRHFPIIYGIGEEGISKNESAERRGRGNQLKGYLMLFEQHLVNHLAQLANLNEFFNIDYKNGAKKTYFTQWLSSVPGIEKLADKNQYSMESLETDNIFFARKNKIYDHLLARFGEELNSTPWKIALQLNLIESEREFNEILLTQKSKFLLQLEDLSYNRMKGESFRKTGENQIVRNPSGLEKFIILKTGIPERENTSLIPDFIWGKTHLSKEVKYFKNIEETNYKPFHIDDTGHADHQTEDTKLPFASFGKIGIKALFKETLNLDNYRIKKSESTFEKVSVIFQKEPNKWSQVFECSDRKVAEKNINSIIDFFIQQNRKTEGIYIIDHILLNDFLADSKYGFSFFDEYGVPLFQTSEEDSWCNSQEERNNRLTEFYKFGMTADSYSQKNGKWIIKNSNGDILASYNSPHEFNDSENRDKVFNKTKSLIHLFGDSEETNGRLRFNEMEKIRLMGTLSLNEKNYGQRRLVFQRKLTTGKVIGEDFFDMNISILLPNWPVRFQNEQFKDYLHDIILERIPSHIAQQIIWVDALKLKGFEDKYFAWEKLKSEQNSSGLISHDLKMAAFDVYRKIMEIKTNE